MSDKVKSPGKPTEVKEDIREGHHPGFHPSRNSRARNQGLSQLLIMTLLIAASVAYFWDEFFINPHWAIAVLRFFNKFDDQTSFNRNENYYLSDVFAPVTSEHINIPLEIVIPKETKEEGVSRATTPKFLPSDLQGILLRIGPNPLPHDESYARGYHWFDGHGMIHAVRLSENKASYTNQWINTPKFLNSKKYNTSNTFVQIGEMQGVAGLGKVLVAAPMLLHSMHLEEYEAGAANTAITFYDNRIIVGHEASLPFEIQYVPQNNSFVSLGYQSYGGKLNYPVTAHPKKDPVDGKLYFDGYHIGDPRKSSMRYGEIDGSQLTTYFDLTDALSAFTHDMMITEHYSLVIESSIIFDVRRIVSGELFKLDENHRLRIGVIPKGAKDNKSMKWFTFPGAFGIIHGINAWEEVKIVDGKETIEIVFHTPMTKEFHGNQKRMLGKASDFQVYELRMNMATGEAAILPYRTNIDIEFPNVHPKFVGRKTNFAFASEIQYQRHLYGTSQEQQAQPLQGQGNRPSFQNHFNAIVKLDLFNRQLVHRIPLPADHVCGEPVLIPKKLPEGQQPAPDDVYLAAFVSRLNAKEENIDVYIYDGKTMNPEPVAVIHGNNLRVPLGFHGLWISEEDLQKHVRLFK